MTASIAHNKETEKANQPARETVDPVREMRGQGKEEGK